MVNLNIGSGAKSEDPNWIGVDAFAEADVKALMWDLPFEDESVDNIYCAQALEHISKFDVVPTLREWVRVLKIGGKIQIVVPDLEWCVWWWLRHQTVDWDLDILYGNQKHEGEYHKTGYTPKILRDYIVIAGSLDIKRMEYWWGDEKITSLGPDDKMGYEVHGRCIATELEKLGGE